MNGSRRGVLMDGARIVLGLGLGYLVLAGTAGCTSAPPPDESGWLDLLLED